MIEGRFEPRFAPVVDELTQQLRRYGGGAAACVFLEGEPVVDVWGGRAHHDGRRWSRDTMTITWSATKGVAVTALHALASEGRVDYDAPVARYWPEFAQNGKGDITVRQVLCHQAGLHRIGAVLSRPIDLLRWDEVAERLAAAAPHPHREKTSGYHALTHGWLVGEIVRRCAGQPFEEVVRTRIAEPLRLDGLYVGVPADQMHRVADIEGMDPIAAESRPVRATPLPPRGLARLRARGLHPRALRRLFGRRELFEVPIPAMNGVCTARSLARMYAALANGGELDGARLVTPEILRRATEVQTTRPDQVVGYPLHWSLGYHRADAIVKAIPEAFGHFGLSGTGGWANPALRLSAALVHNASPVTLRGQVRAVWLTGAVYRSLGLYRGALRTLFGPERTVLR